MDDDEMSGDEEYRLAPASGQAVTLHEGDVLKVIDVEGEQVADLAAFALEDVDESFSPGRTIDYNATALLSVGHKLYSNRSNPMLAISRDTVGKHDLLLAPCSRETFQLLYGSAGEHPSCLQNLSDALTDFAIPIDRIGATFNVFMNVELSANGALRVLPPLSQAGDSIEFQAEMPLVVGVTACAAEKSNNGSLKPISVQVRRA